MKRARPKVVQTSTAIGQPGPKGVALDPLGDPILVIRPAMPEMALAVAAVALERNDKDLIDRLPQEVEDYTVVGWLSARGSPQFIVDEHGKKIGDLVAGDSLVTMHPKGGGEAS
jgi:hypothetical protein